MVLENLPRLRPAVAPLKQRLFVEIILADGEVVDLPRRRKGAKPRVDALLAGLPLCLVHRSPLYRLPKSAESENKDSSRSSTADRANIGMDNATRFG